MLYVGTNSFGDVIGLYSGTGSLLVKYEYDAWGNIISETNASGGNLSTTAQGYSDMCAIRYRGYYYDKDTGLYYLQSRYYNPEVGRFLNSDNVTDNNAGVLGFNTFIYCGNNPVNNSDPTGHGIFKNVIKWVAKNVVKPLVKGIQKTLSKINSTYTTGLSANVSPGIWNFNVQGGISVDNKGNVGVQGTVAGGVTSSGTPTASVGKYSMVTNAPTIDRLNDSGYQFGGSGNIPIPAPVSICVGREFNIIPNDNEGYYYGVTTFKGIAPPVPGIEAHVEWGETGSVNAQINIFDEMQDVYIKIMEW